MVSRARVYVRRGLFVMGVGLLVWWPVSYWFFATVVVPMPRWESGNLMSVAGVLELMFIERSSIATDDLSLDLTSVSDLRTMLPPSTATEMMLHPEQFEFSRVSSASFAATTIALPLWLLVALCLVWPVASFFLRRGREGRGFAVEPAGVDKGGEKGRDTGTAPAGAAESPPPLPGI